MELSKIGRGSLFTHAHTPDGLWKLVDVLDLDEMSFRVFVLSRLADAGLLRPARSDQPVFLSVRIPDAIPPKKTTRKVVPKKRPRRKV